MRRFALAGLVVLAACGGDPKSTLKQANSPHAAPVVETSEPFAIVRVDDSVDAFANISDDQIPFGSGIAIYQETVSLGLHHFGIVHFARLVPRANEGQVESISRFLQWTDKSVPLPPGDRFGFEDVLNYDEATKATTIIGLRTYVLSGAPILTHRDVGEAHIVEGDEDVPELDIAIKLTSDGTRKLADGTRSWPFRRIAILTHGKIDSAPVVKSEITGGAIELAVGSRSDSNVARAKKLVEEMLQK
jgi:hypothetical protein